MEEESEIKGPKILFIYPDRLFNDFIKSFLELKDYTVRLCTDSVEAIRLAINFLPELIILNKEFTGLDAEGFIIKKRTLHAIADLPLFLIGDFSPDELKKFKEGMVKAFISSPLNPVALLERLNSFFNHKLDENIRNTPMLLDIHIKTNVIVTQIEGNLEPVRLELLNYLIRNYCVQKKLRTPKVLLIVPSLYPESITPENVLMLFRFTKYPEIQLDYRCVKVLTFLSPLIKLLKSLPELQNFELVGNYADGIQSLQIDFDKQKKIPVDFLKAGSSYIFDLYDQKGRKIIPAMSRLSENTLAKIKAMNLEKLTYYSDKDISELLKIEIIEEEGIEFLDDGLLLDLITEDFEPIDSEITSLRILDEKQGLFFRKMKGQRLLLMSANEDYKRVITSALDIYFIIDVVKSGADVVVKGIKEHYAIVFIDSDLAAPDATEILEAIRSEVTRHKTSVIILTQKIDKASVIRYRDCGTNNILLSPLTTSRIQQAIFDSVTSDRGT